MPSSRGHKALAIARYTILRIALFAAVWLLLEVLTPLSLGWTLIGAIVMSGAISVVVLDRSRGEAGQAVGGFFRRINARIDASSHAEDEADDRARAEALAASGQGADSSVLAEGEGGSQDQTVGEQENAGGLQGGDESRPTGG